jgi:hypothetical protein
MDFLDSDEDDVTSNSGNVVKNDDKLFIAAVNSIYISLARLKPNQKPRKGASLLISGTIPIIDAEKCVLNRHVFVVSSDEVNKHRLSLIQRLKSAKFTVDDTVDLTTLRSGGNNKTADVLIYLSNNEDCAELKTTVQLIYDALLPGAHFYFVVNNNISPQAILDDYYWNTADLQQSAIEDSMTLLTLRKRCVLCNETAVVYWTNNIERLARERYWIEQVSIPVSHAERETGILSELNHQKALTALTKYGVVIFPKLFNAKKAKEWGDAAIQDMQDLITRLRKKKSIDLLNPYIDKEENSGKIMENFYELSMREALRCDIRNVPNLRRMHESYQYDSPYEWPVYQPVRDASKSIELLHDNSKKASASENFRYHPSILSVLHESMNPPNPVPGVEKGNWGRWNFEGPGPEAPVPLKVGIPGTIFSFPGCADQTIHADTSHLFVHSTLPPHYVNLFVATTENTVAYTKTAEVTFDPADENDALLHPNKSPGTLHGFPIGMTSFVVGSQDLAITKEIMTGEEGQVLLEDRLIRPQLTIGDALLFDCRILHFGLANQLLEKKDSVDGWRPLLYVNYHHTWFHDPKNWNDKERLFE